MNRLVIVLGSFFLSAIIIVIPILTTCSWIFDWDTFFKFLLLMSCAIEYLSLTIIILAESED